MNRADLREHTLGLLSLLGIQFILGTLLNLFVNLPKNHSGTSGGFFSRSLHSFGWAITAGGGVILVLHIVVAIGLLLGSLALVGRALAYGTKAWLIISSIGAVGIIAALTNGLAFIGYNNNINSFVMAMGFMVSATAYSYGLTFTKIPAAAKKARTEKIKSSSGLMGRYHHSHS